METGVCRHQQSLINHLIIHWISPSDMLAQQVLVFYFALFFMRSTETYESIAYKVCAWNSSII